MRLGRWAIVSLVLTGPALAQDTSGLSTPMLPACVAGVTFDRQDSAAQTYDSVALDGAPWLKIGEMTERKKGTQRGAVRVIGTGIWWQRDGTRVPMRFVCMVDITGHSEKLQAVPLSTAQIAGLPAHRLIVGTADVPRDPAVPVDVELRIQLVDPSATPGTPALAEQIVRSSHIGPTPFALRIDRELSLDGRRLAIHALAIQPRIGQLTLAEPRMVNESDIAVPVVLTLSRAAPRK